MTRELLPHLQALCKRIGSSRSSTFAYMKFFRTIPMRRYQSEEKLPNSIMILQTRASTDDLMIESSFDSYLPMKHRDIQGSPGRHMLGSLATPKSQRSDTETRILLVRDELQLHQLCEAMSCLSDLWRVHPLRSRTFTLDDSLLAIQIMGQWTSSAHSAQPHPGNISLF